MPEVKESIFARVFGSMPFVKVLGFFLTFPDFDYSKTQVAKEVEISPITIEKIWKVLAQRKIIIKTRTIGRAEMYRLNTENQEVKIYLKMFSALSNLYLEREKQAVLIEACV